MVRWILGLVLLFGIAALLLVVLLATASGRWNRETAAVVDRPTPSETQIFAAADVAGLPEPVARYFTRTLPEGLPLAKSARLTQEGTFRLGEGEESWRHFMATEWFWTWPDPGFVWDARIFMAPLLRVHVRDTYLSGVSSMRASLGGIRTMVDVPHSEELAQGAAMRYLAEAVWFPTALLPAQGVTWTAVDDASATASLRVGTTVVSLLFRFDEKGDVTEVFAPARYREVEGHFEPTPWRVRVGDVAWICGRRIPRSAVVEWMLDDGPFAVWRGHLIDVVYHPGLGPEGARE